MDAAYEILPGFAAEMTQEQLLLCAWLSPVLVLMIPVSVALIRAPHAYRSTNIVIIWMQSIQDFIYSASIHYSHYTHNAEVCHKTFCGIIIGT